MRVFASSFLLASLLVASASASCVPIAYSFGRLGDGAIALHGGSFVIALQRGLGGGSTEAEPAGLWLTGRLSYTLRLEPIAPGLYRASAPRDLRRGTYRVEGIAAPFTVRAAPHSEPVALPAPQVEAVVPSDCVQLDARYASISATFATPPPEAAVAIVVSTAERAVAWMPRDGSDATSSVIVARVHCDSEPRAYDVPSVGAVVTLQFVDAAGRLSPPSHEIEIAREPAAPRPIRIDPLPSMSRPPLDPG